MKKPILTGLIFLMIALACTNIPILSATATSEGNLWVTPGLPEEVRNSKPSNETVEEYLNTTNPYADREGLGASGEVGGVEGTYPLYVLVFGDEEERGIERTILTYYLDWLGWAMIQLERGDESLVSNFGIDIRILGFLNWDSDDSLDSMYDLWYELEADTKHYLRQWYNGEYWSNYVDAIIGITAQATPGDLRPIAGLAPGPIYIAEGRIFILLKWQIFWADDNLLQHEVSHLFDAEHEHHDPCCAMAYHTHFLTFIWEVDLWPVFADVACGYTSYHWCTSCTATINSNLDRYHPSPILGNVVVPTNELQLPALYTAISAISTVVLVLIKRCKN